jgi:hypothetical protein
MTEPLLDLPGSPDSLPAWLAASPEHRVAAGKTQYTTAPHRQYVAWCQAHGLLPVGAAMFGVLLYRAGLVQVEPPKKRDSGGGEEAGEAKGRPDEGALFGEDVGDAD